VNVSHISGNNAWGQNTIPLSQIRNAYHPIFPSSTSPELEKHYPSHTNADFSQKSFPSHKQIKIHQRRYSSPATSRRRRYCSRGKGPLFISPLVLFAWIFFSLATGSDPSTSVVFSRSLTRLIHHLRCCSRGPLSLLPSVLCSQTQIYQ